jgi:hypothetical protein
MDIDRQNVPLDHFGIFRDQCYLPKRTTCYYGCEKGQVHKTTPRVKWSHEMNESLDLKINLKKEKKMLSSN